MLKLIDVLTYGVALPLILFAVVGSAMALYDGLTANRRALRKAKHILSNGLAADQTGGSIRQQQAETAREIERAYRLAPGSLSKEAGE